MPNYKFGGSFAVLDMSRLCLFEFPDVFKSGSIENYMRDYSN